jgi:septation ring formation regulator EzrA
MSDGTIDELSSGELAVVVEMQRVELNRLLGEQRRLNDRIDKLLELQEREQVLRQQMQAALDRLAAQRGADIGEAGTQPTISGMTAGDMPLLEDRLDRTERKFSALRDAVAQLVTLLERQKGGGGSVRVFAPRGPDT